MSTHETERHPIQELVERIDALIGKITIESSALWTVRDIGAYLSLGETTVMQKITCAPDFPKPINVTGESKGRRWKPVEVKAWVDGRRETLPRPRQKRA